MACRGLGANAAKIAELAEAVTRCRAVVAPTGADDCIADLRKVAEEALECKETPLAKEKKHLASVEGDAAAVGAEVQRRRDRRAQGGATRRQERADLAKQLLGQATALMARLAAVDDACVAKFATSSRRCRPGANQAALGTQGEGATCAAETAARAVEAIASCAYSRCGA